MSESNCAIKKYMFVLNLQYIMWHSDNYRRIYCIQLLHKKWSILHWLLLKHPFVVTDHRLPQSEHIVLRHNDVNSSGSSRQESQVTPSSSTEALSFIPHVGAFWFHNVKKLERKVREKKKKKTECRCCQTRRHTTYWSTSSVQLRIINPRRHFCLQNYVNP